MSNTEEIETFGVSNEIQIKDKMKYQTYREPKSLSGFFGKTEYSKPILIITNGSIRETIPKKKEVEVILNINVLKEGEPEAEDPKVYIWDRCLDCLENVPICSFYMFIIYLCIAIIFGIFIYNCVSLIQLANLHPNVEYLQQGVYASYIAFVFMFTGFIFTYRYRLLLPLTYIILFVSLSYFFLYILHLNVIFRMCSIALNTIESIDKEFLDIFGDSWFGRLLLRWTKSLFDFEWVRNCHSIVND